MSPGVWVAFLAAAAVGAPVRYLVDGFVQDRTAGAFPWGTWVINVAARSCSGCSAAWSCTTPPRPTWLVLGTGFCGAYTTFSTFTFETVRLVEDGLHRAALRNVALNTGGGLLAAAAGLAIAAL